ncbi:Nrk1 [Trypoxylus dichotomus]
MSKQWLIIGISGATCGGKTTIANNLNSIFPGSRVLSQDSYFLPVDDDRHVWIPELNHINFDILTSLDMDKMHSDIKEIVAGSICKIDTSKSKCSERSPLISGNLTDLQEKIKEMLIKKKVNILIVEGFCIFYHKPIESLCNLKYFVTLNKEECHKRRLKRVYEPPDCPGYFEHCVWPEYLRQLEDVKSTIKNVHYISEFTEDPIKVVLNDLVLLLDGVIE